MPTFLPPAPISPLRFVRRWLWFAALLALLAGCAWGGYLYQIQIWDRACRVAQKEKRWADLETTAQTWSLWAPRSAEPWAFLADGVQNQQRYVEAAEYLARVPAHLPQSLAAQIARSKLQFGPANRPFDGEQTCLDLLTREPRVGEAHQLLIQFYTVTLQRTKLRQQIQQAITVRREPRDAYVYYFLMDSIRLGDGTPLNELWLESFPDHEVLLVAKLLHSEDKLHHDPTTPPTESLAVVTDKESAARELLQRFPHNANLLAYLIDQELSKGRIEQVVELLTAAPVEAESDQRFWRFKGWVHFVREEHEQAEKAYRQALRLHPMDWLSMHRLAEILRMRGETEEVVHLQNLVKHAHELRIRIRDLPSVMNPPTPILMEIGRLARDAGDQFLTEALQYRLGSLEPRPAKRAEERRHLP